MSKIEFSQLSTKKKIGTYKCLKETLFILLFMVALSSILRLRAYSVLEHGLLEMLIIILTVGYYSISMNARGIKKKQNGKILCCVTSTLSLIFIIIVLASIGYALYSKDFYATIDYQIGLLLLAILLCADTIVRLKSRSFDEYKGL